MKKTLAMLSALAMLTALPVTAFAGDTETVSITTNNGTGNTQVEYEVNAAYTVTIPAAVTLSNENVKASIGFSDVMLPVKQKISVILDDAENKTIASEFNVVQGSDKDISAAYTVTDSTKQKTYHLKDEVAFFEYDGKTNSGSADIYFTAPNGAKYAGTYTDKLTFKISVDNAEVKADGITLNKGTLSLALGKAETLTATISPEETTDKTVTWTSSNTDVATVDSTGKVTAKSAGKAVITAATANGKTAECAVSVIDHVEIKNTDYPEKGNNTVNFDPIDTGLVTVTFDDNGDQCFNDLDENGWAFYGNNATVTVASSSPEVQIVKVKFYTKNGSAEVTQAPFTVYSYDYDMYTGPNGTGICFNDWGVTKIEVYFTRE